MTTTSTLHPEPNPAPVGVEVLHDPPRTSVGGDRLRLLTPGSRAHRALLTAALVGGLLFNLTVWVDGFFRPGYNAFRQPESALSLGPGGWVQITNFIVFGILNLCFALALRKTLAPGRGSTWGPVLQGIAGLSMIIVGIFVEDPSKGYPIGVVPPGFSDAPWFDPYIGDLRRPDRDRCVPVRPRQSTLRRAGLARVAYLAAYCGRADDGAPCRIRSRHGWPRPGRSLRKGGKHCGHGAWDGLLDPRPAARWEIAVCGKP